VSHFSASEQYLMASLTVRKRSVTVSIRRYSSMPHSIKTPVTPCTRSPLLMRSLALDSPRALIDLALLVSCTQHAIKGLVLSIPKHLLSSETSSLHWKCKLRNVWGQSKGVSTLWRCFRTQRLCCVLALWSHTPCLRVPKSELLVAPDPVCQLHTVTHWN